MRWTPPKSQTNLGSILYAIATGISKPLVPPAVMDFTKDLTGSQINWRMHRVKRQDFSNSYFSALVILASWLPFATSTFSYSLLPFPPRVRKQEGEALLIPLEDSLSLLLQGTFLVYSFQMFISFFLLKMETSFFFLMFVIGLLALEARTSVYWEPKKKRLKKQRLLKNKCYHLLFLFFRVLQLGPHVPSFSSLLF